MPKLPQYSKELLDKALEDISKGAGIRATAKKYDIPKSSIHFNLKNPNKKSDFGPNPYLSKEEENELENWICDMGRKGFPRSKDDILDSVQAFLNANPRETPFKDNRPGRGWLKGFLKRHPKISDRKPESVSQASSCVSEADIRKWFGQIMEYVKNNNLEEVLQDPSRVFNADESGFRTCPSSGRVYAEKGEKNVYIIDKGKSKESVTTLFSISADGKTVLPTIVYAYQRLPDRIRQSVPPEWGIATSPSGWMTADTFQFFIEHILYPHLVQNKVQFPVILFVDGHRSHLSYNLSIIASNLRIEIIALYPNSTHILQPADVSLFRPVKQLWKQALREWLIENDGECVNKQNFAMVLKKVVDKVNPNCIVNGFRACGLYPFNADAVDYSKCLAKSNPPIEPAVGPTNHPDMPFEKFVNIVGQDTIVKFERISEIVGQEENSEEFYTLFRIWEFYTSNLETAEVAAENREIVRSPDPTAPVGFTQQHSIDTSDIDIYAAEHMPNNELENNPVCSSMNTSSEGIMTSTVPETEDIEINPACSSLNRSSEEIIPLTVPDTEDVETNPACSSLIRSSEEITPLTVPNTEDVETNPAGSSLNISSEEIIALTVPETENIETRKTLKEFLMRPAEPKRKGKRQVARLSFNISSKEYQRALEDKAREKMRIEEEKKLKKQEREEKKRKREEEKKNRTQKKRKISNKNQDITNEPGTSKNTDRYSENVRCDKCSRNVKEELKVKCSECARTFHISCVPKKHAQHIPEREDEDIFLCHICYDVPEERSESGNSDSDGSITDIYKNIQIFNKDMGFL